MFWTQQVIISLVALTTYVSCQGSALFECPLVWEKVTFGGNVEDYAIVKGHGNTHLIARFGTPLLGYVLGRSSLLPGRPVIQNGYFPNVVDTVGEIQTEFEILTNPHGCTTSWVLKTHPNSKSEFHIPADESQQSTIVGKAEYDENLLAGQVQDEIITIVTEELDFHQISDFLLLISTSKGIIINIRDFVFETDPVYSSDLASVEEFHNRVEAEIIQTVTHSRKISERFSMTSGKEVGIGWSVGVSGYLGAFWFGFGLKEEYHSSEGGSESETITHEQETDIAITRKIRIPPNQSIQACSRILTSGEYTSNYRAVAVYKILGWPATEVKEYIETVHGIVGIEIIDDEVTKEISGVFSSMLALTTEFIVVSLDWQDECHSVQIDIKEWLERSKHKERANDFPRTNLTGLLTYWTT